MIFNFPPNLREYQHLGKALNAFLLDDDTETTSFMFFIKNFVKYIG